jgi:hypothetical protein
VLDFVFVLLILFLVLSYYLGSVLDDVLLTQHKVDIFRRYGGIRILVMSGFGFERYLEKTSTGKPIGALVRCGNKMD